MASGVHGASRRLAILSLRIVLGLLFLAIGTTKLSGTANTVPYFAAIGIGQWFRYLTGLLDLAGAALLCVPRWTCYGAILLACSVGSATVIAFTVLRGNLTWGGPATIAVPFIFTLLAATLAWITRPQRPS